MRHMQGTTTIQIFHHFLRLPICSNTAYLPEQLKFEIHYQKIVDRSQLMIFCVPLTPVDVDVYVALCCVYSLSLYDRTFLIFPTLQ